MAIKSVFYDGNQVASNNQQKYIHTHRQIWHTMNFKL
jgi:hypothetical protein